VRAKHHSAVERFSWEIKDRDPTTAISWAVSLSDPERRAKQIQGLARNCLAYDATAAKQWLASTTELPDEVKRQLVSPQ